MGKILSRLGIEVEELTIESCRECMQILEIDRPEHVFETELCALYINPEWSKEVIGAILLLKRNNVTTEQYDQAKISCKVEVKKDKKI